MQENNYENLKKMDDRLGLRINPTLKKRLQEYADKKGVPLSKLILLWLSERLDDETNLK